MRRFIKRLIATAGVISMLVAAVLWGQLPAIGAGGLLHPERHVTHLPPPDHCVAADFAGEGITLKGWRCSTTDSVRGTIVYLHGIADNRSSATGVIQRFLARGFNVIAYDNRAHGESQGDACTYGFFEKQDLHRVIDTIGSGPVVLMGTSLGAAVALQEAADDPRVSAVVAAETYSDIRTVATERAPAFFTAGIIDRAFALAESQAHFQADAVSPQKAAERITAPVLLIHGADDVDTPPEHSKRVFAALKGPKRLILVPGAAHNGSLRSDVWPQIDQWIDDVLGDAARARPKAP